VASAYAFTGTNQTDLPFTAPGSGVFFVEAIDQDGDQAGYSISLTRR
jgi:imidazole glycerol phosphate synthase subunit HisF